MHKFIDENTGLEYKILTDGKNPCRKFYFSMESWTKDDQWVLYHEDVTEGGHTRTELHKVNQFTGEDVVLSKDAPCFGMSRAADIGYYLQCDTLYRLDVHSGDVRDVAQLEAGLTAQGHFTVSKSGLVVNTYQQRCGIYALIVTDPATGASETCYRSDGRLGHCQFNPGDDDTIFYVHETGGDALQRMWMYKRSENSVRPYFVEQEGDWITHETWDVSGEELSFIRWPHAIMSGKKNGQAFRVVSEGEYHHAAANGDRSFYSADRTSQGKILLVNGCTGNAVTVVSNQYAQRGEDHCHPSFNRSGSAISFSAPGAIGNLAPCQIGVLELSQVTMP